MPFKILRQDITKMKVDAIVNAANRDLKMGGGVCGAIFRSAGAIELQEACNILAPIETGEAVLTPAFNLPSKHIIHTVGPIYNDDRKEECEKSLRIAYINSLKLAVENKFESIAFPLISSGIYGYPKKEALNIATSAILDFLKEYDLDVTLLVFDKSAFMITQDLLGELDSYIDDYYVDSIKDRGRSISFKEMALYKEASLEEMSKMPVYEDESLDKYVNNLEEPFRQLLFRLIDAKGMTDVEVYKAANLDRRLFSKIRNNKNYMPSKVTALSLALALRLNLEEADSFLERAGYALSHAVKFDVIIEYFIINGNYDIFEINEVLFYYDQPLLGGI